MRRFLLALFCLAPLAAPLAAQAAVNLAEAPIGRLSLPWWQAYWDSTLAQARATPNAKIVWLGDSITYYWQRQGSHGYDDIMPVWQANYAPYNALDFGFIGDTTASLIWRLDHGQVTGLHPRLAIILIGANNFGAVHWDASMTIPGIESVVRLTHRKLPGAHILLIGVLPSIRSPWVDAQTLTTNAALARAYQNNQLISFVNLRPLFLQNGKIAAADFVDPSLSPNAPALHPTRATMSRIAAALAPLVQQYAGAP